jgi:hypothetical protein
MVLLKVNMAARARTIDLSPSARFCISEAEIVTALYNGPRPPAHASRKHTPALRYIW